MRTNKNTITEPQLWVDDHHGQYMGKIAYEQLNDRYKAQANKALSEEDIKSILDTDCEFHHESVDNFTRIDFETETGQKFNLQFAEGGIWLIPFCFYRSKQANEFFGC